MSVEHLCHCKTRDAAPNNLIAVKQQCLNTWFIYLFFHFNSHIANLFHFQSFGDNLYMLIYILILTRLIAKKKTGHCLTNYWNTGAFLRSSTWIVTWVMTEEQSWVNVHLSATLFASGSLLHGWMTAAGGFCHNCDWCICLERGWETVDLLGMHEGRKKNMCAAGVGGGQITMQKGPLSVWAVCELHGVCDCFSFFKLASSFSISQRLCCILLFCVSFRFSCCDYWYRYDDIRCLIKADFSSWQPRNCVFM